MTCTCTVDLPDLAATERLADRLAQFVEAPLTIALVGTLGAGKTQWIRYFCKALGVPSELVTSPTYVLHQLYRGAAIEIHHFDFYRLQYSAQVWDLGIDELQNRPVLILVEWADRFPETLPSDRLQLRLLVTDTDQRRAELVATGERSTRLLAQAGFN